MIGTIMTTFLSPIILFFFVGIFAMLVKSDLEIPPQLSKGLSLYLMIAIGFKGGASFAGMALNWTLVGSLLSAVVISFTLPFIAYFLLKKINGVNPVDSAAIAAHYGSVSAVTFATAMTMLTDANIFFEPYVVALMALMEAPAIVSGLFLAGRYAKTENRKSILQLISESFNHGSIVLMFCSMLVGLITGTAGMEIMAPLVLDPFKAILAVFLLDMGLLTGKNISSVESLNLKTFAFGIYMPIIGGMIGSLIGTIIGMSVGGATLLAVLAASASYIVVPAVMKENLPEANPALYLTLSLVITFTFNILFGIPLYQWFATILGRII